MTHLKAKSISDYMKKKSAEKLKALQPDVPNARFWIAGIRGILVGRPEVITSVVIECERFYDARDVARSIFSNFDASEIEVSQSADASFVLPRVQVRWVGSAAGLNDLHKEARTLRAGKNNDDPWVRLIDFKFVPALKKSR